MKQYKKLLKHILEHGRERTDRTGTGTYSVFGYQMRFNLAEGFPLVTTKQVHLKSIIHELIWFLQGSTNTKYLKENGVTIWDEWRRPYSLERPYVFVEPKLREYVPYEGKFSCSGVNAPKGSIEEKLADTWKRMMRRCYDPSHEKFAFYGAKGASVCARWHSPSTFIEDAKHLPHWYYKSTSWSSFHLDKDYFGANQYGPDTSVWLRHDENSLYTTAAIPLRVVSVDGVERVYLSASHAAKGSGISTSSMSRFIGTGPLSGVKGANKNFIGWVFEPVKTGLLLRLDLIEDGDLGPIYSAQWRSWPKPDGGHIDQISEVIRQLKETPDSRRIIVSAWNVADLNDMALPPCHAFFQFYTEELTPGERHDCAKKQLQAQGCNMEEPGAFKQVYDEDGEFLPWVPRHRLSCQLYQRSADVFLGVPFNIASYALLTMMVAQVCNMALGDFVWTGGDCHLYKNHLNQARMQLERYEYPLPRMVLNKEVKDLFSFVYDDFTLEGYTCWPAIKAPVAV